MGGTGIWLAASPLNIASVILQATCSGEKGDRFVAESARRGAGRWVGWRGDTTHWERTGSPIA